MAYGVLSSTRASARWPICRRNRLAIPRPSTIGPTCILWCATLYHAVTGRLPFSGNNAAQMILRHIEDVPAPPMSIAPICLPRFPTSSCK